MCSLSCCFTLRGARSCSASLLCCRPTRLPRPFFCAPSLDELIKHGLKALQACLQDGDLTSANSAIAVVGKDLSFTVLVRRVATGCAGLLQGA